MAYTSSYTGTQIDAAVSRSAAKTGNTISFIGASLAGHCMGGTALDFFAYANYLLKGRFSPLGNQAYGGDTPSDAMPKLTALLAYNSQYIFISSGLLANGLMNSVSTATLKTQMDTIFQACLDEGRIVIVTSIPPGDTTTWYNTEAKRTAFYELNDWVRRYAQSQGGMIFVDTSKYLVDGTSSGPAPKTGLTSDGIHVNAQGAYLMGKAIFEALDEYIPKIDILPIYKDNDLIISSNPMMTGTTGNDHTNTTGDVADSLTIEQDYGSAVVSKVARTDGLPGEWQRVVITSGAANTTVTRISILSLAGDHIGTTTELLCEMFMGGSWTGLKGVAVIASYWNEAFTENTSLVGLHWYVDSAIGDLVLPVGAGVWISSNNVVVPVGSYYTQIVIDITTAAGGSGTLDIGRVAARKIIET